MPWLVAATVLGLAGHAPSVTGGPDAVAYAERLIEQHTLAIWGSSATATVKVRLHARSFLLPLPDDITAVASISPEPFGGYALEREMFGLGLQDSVGQPVAWGAGTWTVTCTRGRATIPPDVVKAASLLAAHYLALSDPDRSRYQAASLGDFAGTMRLCVLPVPEAEVLLARYRALPVGVSG